MRPQGLDVILVDLGPFSILLAVKDLRASKSFYEKLGFIASAPDPSNKNWLSMKNGDVVIGIFQGIFDENTLCFNPGGRLGKPLARFTDIRELHRELKAKGVKTTEEGGLTSKKGPAGFVVTDPDGNPILFDQHV
jgi:lactoylglutathione lyase